MSINLATGPDGIVIEMVLTLDVYDQQEYLNKRIMQRLQRSRIPL